MSNVNHMSLSMVVLFSLLLTACGGGGSGGSSGGSSAVATVAKVEIQQTGLLLTDMGATRQLSAVAYDAQGGALSVPIQWSSTQTAIGVDGSGKVTAATNNGSSQIVAEANGVKSAPLLVVVTTLPAGAILLTDAQIVGEPFETDPNAPPSFDNTYKVVLTGVGAPAMGTLLINTESKPVAGRVVAVDTAGGQTTVTLALVSLRELFPSLSVNEVIDLSQAPVSVPDNIAADYDMQRNGNTFTFTPKLTVASVLSAVGVVKPQAVGTPIGTGPLLPFTECKRSLTGIGADAPLPIGLSAPPLFSVTINPTLDMVVTPGNGLERFVIKAEPVIKVEGSVNISAAFEGKIECTADLFILRVPVGGPLSLVVSGLMPVGVGLEVGGKITVATLGLGTDVTYKAKTEFGLVCPNGANCAFARSLSGDLQKPNYKVDAPSLGDLRLEPSIAAFGSIGADIGNPFLKKLRFEAFKAKAGGKLQGSFAPQISQILDTNYKSDYKVSFEASAGVGSELGEVVKLLGLASVSALELVVSIDLATSPAGTVTADRTTFVTGDTVNFRVAMDPAKVNFVDLYNIKKILLVRDSGGSQTLVGSLVASPGQTDFNFTFTAPGPGAVSEFFAFVDTVLLPSLDVLTLEVGNAQVSASKIAFASSRDGNNEIYVMNADGSGQTRATNNRVVDAVPAWSPDGARIAFLSSSLGGNGIYVMNADGSGVTRLTFGSGTTFGDGKPSWSHDGTRIAFRRDFDSGSGNDGIYVMNADGSGQTRLTTNADIARDDQPAWSPDGTRVAFTSQRDGGYREIYIMNSNGSGQTRLTDDSANGHDELPTWSPDGTRIAFTSTRDGNAEIYVMNADGSGQTRLINNAATDAYPAWSPDGTRIAFASTRDGNFEIYVMNADGSGQTRVTNNAAVDYYPAWSR